jgi:GNAT superfamily N-acetyltransferase
MGVLVRAATAADAGAVGSLLEEFQTYLRGLGDHTDFKFDDRVYLRDGFGPRPAFAGFVAEADGQIVGYLLYHYGYDSDQGERLMYVLDLYVRQERRGLGAGRALMERAAATAHEAGARTLAWSVYAPNALAFAFYERLGARYESDLKLMSWRPAERERQHERGA